MRTASIAAVAPLVSLALAAACESPSDPAALKIQAHSFANAEWSAPVNLGSAINTAFNEQGPALSNDGLRLYFGSDRPNGLGGFDIWVSRRACTGCPWETPAPLPAPVNSAAFETGPGLSFDGHLLFFRSTREGGQGLGDVYVARRANPKDDFGWEPPVGLGTDVNTPAEEAGAEYVQTAEEGSANLYFNRAPPGGTADLFYVSVTRDGETRGPAVVISELSHPTATDQGPTVRGDGREMLFFSTRPGGSGGPDLWTSSRRSIHDPWSAPVNLASLNTAGLEQQPSLSGDGRTLVFASSRPGGSGGTDIWMSTRTPSGH
jgi:WD40-like Beta Propeller Repeat